MFKYQVTTNFDQSVSLFEDWQDAVAYVKIKVRNSNKVTTDFTIEYAKL